MAIIAGFVCVVLLILIFYVYRRFYCHLFFKKLGISGPEPHWLFGNTVQLWRQNEHLLIADWSKKYGEIFGFYYGAKPVLVISSVHAVESVCVKQFSDFHGHKVLPTQPDTDKDPDHPQSHLVFAEGNTWKRLRMICNPAFSSAKLKSYMFAISRCQGEFLDVLFDYGKSGEIFDVTNLYQRLTMEVIAEVFFSMRFDVIKNRLASNVLMDSLLAFRKALSNPPSLIKTALCLSELIGFFKLILWIQFKLLVGFLGEAGRALLVVERMVEERRANLSKKPDDALQMLMEVCDKAPTSGNFLSKDELIRQCFMLFIAGYDTTSNSLSFASYLLAKNPDVQERLARELVICFPKKEDGTLPEIDIETIMTKIPYLEMVIKESLRLFPVSINTMTRTVTNETTLCGFKIPKSTWGVHLDTWTIHHDERLWGPVDTNKFYPERFSPDYSSSRPEASFLSFGYGPRQCLGNRLAMLQMKITLTNILLRYKIVLPASAYPNGEISVSTKSGPMIAVGGVPIKLLPRF